jgi:hypothetical protein
MDQSVYDILHKVGEEVGLPQEIWYPIVMHESKGDPYAHNKTDKEDSRGLFQVNINAHPDANSSQLFDPEYNARYMMPKLKDTYEYGAQKGVAGEDLAVYVERYGERPAWTEQVENSIRTYYKEGVNLYGYDQGPGAPATPTTSNPIGNNPIVLPIGNVTPPGANPTPTTPDPNKPWYEEIWDNIREYFFIFILFLILIFSLYMIFIYKPGQVERVINKAGKAAAKGAETAAEGGATEVAE